MSLHTFLTYSNKFFKWQEINVKIMLLNIFTYTENIYKIIFLELEEVFFKKLSINRKII